MRTRCGSTLVMPVDELLQRPERRPIRNWIYPLNGPPGVRAALIFRPTVTIVQLQRDMERS